MELKNVIYKLSESMLYDIHTFEKFEKFDVNSADIINEVRYAL